jgi:hypothetical protein
MYTFVHTAHGGSPDSVMRITRGGRSAHQRGAQRFTGKREFTSSGSLGIDWANGVVAFGQQPNRAANDQGAARADCNG